MNNNFSVLFLSSWYPSKAYISHGIFVQNLAKALSEYCKVVVIYVSSSSNVKQTEIETIVQQNLYEYKVTFQKSKIPILKNFIHFFYYLYYYSKLTSIVKKEHTNIQAIQINIIYPISVFLFFIKRKLSIKHYTIFEQWTGYLPLDNAYKGIFRKAITKMVAKKSTRIFCLCKEQKDAMITRGIKGTYEVIGNVVDTTVFDMQKKEENNSIKTFIHVSTLDNRQKNIFGMLDVFKEIENAGYNFSLKIIGGKDVDLVMAKSYVSNLKLKNVIFEGLIPQQDLKNYYQTADALVMFSNYETFCVAIYESLACGTPVITTDVANLGEVIDKDMGDVIPINNKLKLKESIVAIIKNEKLFNPQTMRSFVEKNYSSQIIGKKLFNYYNNLINHES